MVAKLFKSIARIGAIAVLGGVDGANGSPLGFFETTCQEHPWLSLVIGGGTGLAIWGGIRWRKLCCGGQTQELNKPTMNEGVATDNDKKDEEPGVNAKPPGQIVQATVPAGCSAGQQIQFTTPSGSQVMDVIPQGLVPGQSFHLQLPQPAAIAARESASEEEAAKSDSSFKPAANEPAKPAANVAASSRNSDDSDANEREELMSVLEGRGEAVGAGSRVKVVETFKTDVDDSSQTEINRGATGTIYRRYFSDGHQKAHIHFDLKAKTCLVKGLNFDKLKVLKIHNIFVGCTVEALESIECADEVENNADPFYFDKEMCGVVTFIDGEGDAWIKVKGLVGPQDTLFRWVKNEDFCKLKVVKFNNICVGCTVKALNTIECANEVKKSEEPKLFHAGKCGKVLSIDKEGDAKIELKPASPENTIRRSSRWVDHVDFCDLEVVGESCGEYVK